MKLAFNAEYGGVEEFGADGFCLPIRKPAPLWELVVETPGGAPKTLTALDCPPPSMAEDSAGVRLEWRASEGLGVVVHAICDGARVEWRLSVENQSPSCLVKEIFFPVLGEFAAQSDDYLALPWQWGMIVPDPVTFAANDTFKVPTWTGRERFAGKLAGEYPGIMAMQFLLYGAESGGVCYAIHDTKASYKRFGLYSSGAETARLAARHYPPEAVAPGQCYELPYPVVTEIYEGASWCAGAALYRKWAATQSWCAEGRVANRRHTPDWAKNVALWYWNWWYADEKGDVDRILPALKSIQKRLPGRIAFHWYGWNNQYHDNDYPEYKFLHPNDVTRLQDAVRQYHEADVKVFPYVNGRLWNIDTDSWHSEHGADGATRCSESRPGEVGRYNIENVLGSPYAVMCPFTRLWQDKVMAFVERVLDFGLDGAYIDQISSAFAVPCRTKAHGHSVNGGDFWHQGYQTMMLRLRERLGGRFPEAVFTSESVIECFINAFDLYLGYQCVLWVDVFGPQADTIPLFSAVYHDFVQLYGTGSLFRQDDFFFAQAKDITGGVQPSLQGYFTEDVGEAESTPKIDFLVDWAQRHWQVRHLLQNAVLVDYMQMDNASGGQNRHARLEPARHLVLSSLWQCAGGERLLLAVNHTEKPQTFRLPNGNWREILPDGKCASVQTERPLELPPRSIHVFME